MWIKEPEVICSIGAGTIGMGWALWFADKSFEVKLYDIQEEILSNAMERIESNCNLWVDEKVTESNSTKEIINRIHPTTNIEEALKDVDLVQESVSEDYEVKKQIFRKVDRICSENALIASSTSGLLITEIQKVTNNPERCFVAHPLNPPHLIPLIELVPGEKTSKRVIATAVNFYKSLGKVPVVLNKEIPGHVANRLQAALWREAIDLVLNDIVSVEAIDKILSNGPGVRWAFMGPHLVFHLAAKGGIEETIDHLGPAFESWWSSMNQWKEFPQGAQEKLKKGIEKEVDDKSIPEITTWRDRKLCELLKMLK